MTVYSNENGIKTDNRRTRKREMEVETKYQSVMMYNFKHTIHTPLKIGQCHIPFLFLSFIFNAFASTFALRVYKHRHKKTNAADTPNLPKPSLIYSCWFFSVSIVELNWVKVSPGMKWMIFLEIAHLPACSWHWIFLRNVRVLTLAYTRTRSLCMGFICWGGIASAELNFTHLNLYMMFKWFEYCFVCSLSISMFWCVWDMELQQ